MVKFDRPYSTLSMFRMVFFRTSYLLALASLISLSTSTALLFGRPAGATAQALSIPDDPTLAQAPEGSPDGGEAQPPAEPQPQQDDLRPLSQTGSSILSVSGGQRLMQEASSAVSSQDYEQAVQKLQQARQVFNQLSNFYQELSASFSGIDTRIADQQREQAVSTAQMRDEATYQLALVHRAQNKPELAVPLLIQIVRSQNPTRELGQRAYQQLFELGFVSSPFPRAGEPASANPQSQ
jgi:hypothetical protein